MDIPCLTLEKEKDIIFRFLTYYVFLEKDPIICAIFQLHGIFSYIRRADQIFSRENSQRHMYLGLPSTRFDKICAKSVFRFPSHLWKTLNNIDFLMACRCML